MCKSQGTRQSGYCRPRWTSLCRVQKPGHTEKVGSLPCANARAHVIGWAFALCQTAWHTTKETESRQPPSSTFFCREPHSAHDKVLAVCPIKGTRQRASLPMLGCHGFFAVCYTRQRVCYVQTGLFRVPLAHGKCPVSRSESSSPVVRQK